MNEPAFSLNEPTLSPVATLAEADRTPSAPAAAEPDSFDSPDSAQCFGRSAFGRARGGTQDAGDARALGYP